jgi:hypothetical protein
METSQQILQVLYTRMERLERQNRFLRNTILTGLLIIICVTTMAQAKAARTVEAERFVLRDGNGRARITIGTPESSGASINTPNDEPSIWISDSSGVDRAIVTTEGIRLANVSGKPAATLSFTAKQGGEIRLYDNEGKLLYHAP